MLAIWFLVWSGHTLSFSWAVTLFGRLDVRSNCRSQQTNIVNHLLVKMSLGLLSFPWPASRNHCVILGISYKAPGNKKNDSRILCNLSLTAGNVIPL